MSAVIPWTDPGGTPCCCNVCTSETFVGTYLPAGLPVWSQQITPELFNALRLLNSSSLTYALNVEVSMNMGISTTYPSGYAYNFSQTFGQQYESFTKTNPVASNTGCNLFVALAHEFGAPSVAVYGLWSASLNAYLTTALRASFYIFIRDGGSGYPGTSPSPSVGSPMMYVAGRFQISDFSSGADPQVKPGFLPNSQPSSVRFTFDDAGGTSVNVNILGYPAKFIASFNANGGTHSIDWKVSLTAPPP